MAKIRSLLNLLKKLFVSDPKGNLHKREKKRRWNFGRFKAKRLPALAAPPSVAKERTFVGAETDHSRQALAAAIASAVAAEAAVASAEAAVEVVRLIGTPWSYTKPYKGSRVLAAIRIQTAFRGYLARKALRALKGLVRLQAMVRGQAVRRQVTTTLSGLQTLVKIQSKLHVTRKSSGEKQLIKNFNELEENETMFGKCEFKSQRALVNMLPSKEDIDALFMDRRDILIKRERVKEYLFSQKEKPSSKESEVRDVKRSFNHQLTHSDDAQERNGKVSEKSTLFLFSNPGQRNIEVRTGTKLGDSKYNESLATRNSPSTPPRRSFERPKRNSFEDSDPLASPVIPNYMSATESAKARLRSISLRKKGPGSLEMYSDHGSPSKNIPPFSSDTSTTVKSSRGGSNSQQRSPSLKGVLGPIKSYQTSKELSVDSDSSFYSFVKHSGVQ